MSTAKQALLAQFLNQPVPVQIYPAKVLEVSGTVCTVELLSSGLQIPDVPLVADPDAEEYFILTPRKGSKVLVAAVENEIAKAFVVFCSEVDSVSVALYKSKLTIDKDGILLQNNSSDVTLNQDAAQLRQGGTLITLKGKKVEIKNEATSLKSLFDDLSTMIQNLKVVTPQGLSTALGPDTIVSLTSFKTKYPTLLQ